MVAFALGPLQVSARSHQVQAIDQYCAELRSELISTAPFIFAGPDPWTQIDNVPQQADDDDTLAYVFTEGPSIRWVFLRITDKQNGWLEEVHYYFRPDGTIAKRARHLLSFAANVEFDEALYYTGGNVSEQVTHHHKLLKKGKRKADFSDPDAPEYKTVGELPFGDIADLWDRVT